MTSTASEISRTGDSLLRVEDVHLLIGDTTFVANSVPRGAAVAHYVTSPIAHARIVSIDVTEALAAPGVLAVVTGHDVAAAGLTAPVPGQMPVYPDGTGRTVLARDRVRFVGEAIVAVVADTETAAVDAAELVVIDFEPLEAVIDLKTAPDMSPLFDNAPNLIITEELPESNAIDFSQFEVVVEATITNNRVAPAPLEGRVASAQWIDGRLVQHAACQGVHPFRNSLAQWYGLEADQVRVTTSDVGGSFGAKARVYPEDLLLGHLSRLIDRPVVWVAPRSADMVGLGHSRAQLQTFTIAGDRSGRIRALQAHVRQDLGGFPGAGLALGRNACRMLPGPYDIEHVHWTLEGVLTNTTPTVAYRGAGRPEGGSLANRAVDLFAAEIAMDPVEVRRMNLLRPEQLPWMNPTGVHYDTGDYPDAFEQVLAAVDYEAVRSEQQARLDAGDPRLLGVGLAVFVDRTAGVPGTEYGSLHLNADGTFLVLTGSSPYGQGHYTTWMQLVSERTGVPVDQITVKHGDTDLVPRGGITGGSKSVQKAGSALALAANDMVERARAKAADMLEAAESDVVLDLEAGRFHVTGAPGASSVGWVEIAATVLAEQAEQDADTSEIVWACESDYEPDGHTVPYGAYAAVVEVDRETGGVTLQRMVTLDDAGTIINPMLALGQVHGGVGQGIGQVLFEEFIYDDDGTPLTGDLLEYGFPSAAEMPSFETILTEHPTPHNPLGAKGIGESGTIGAVPAVHNAVIDAVAHLGIRHIDMPLTAQRVWRAINAARSSE